jgi:hypothetical protein
MCLDFALSMLLEAQLFVIELTQLAHLVLTKSLA